MTYNDDNVMGGNSYIYFLSGGMNSDNDDVAACLKNTG
jgi:hypothetical protein